MRSLEVKALFQKNFLNDNLRAVLNINVEDRWEKGGLDHYDQSSALEFYTGVAYNLTPDWSLAADPPGIRSGDLALMVVPKN